MLGIRRWRSIAVVIASLAAIVAATASASARGLAVEVWTDRGADAVYEPGESIQIGARSSDDAYLLVYEIDAEGYVHVLFPLRGESGSVPARETLALPGRGDAQELVVQGPVGQGYIVAIAAHAPFHELPWYLRPYDPQGEGVGYVGSPNDEEGITAEGRIVGDPFVAMERIRRRVVEDPEDQESFATDYASYYVHERVRYPRYVCYDCHRPQQWSWWDGFDPYYTSCSAFDFRVNFNWGWGRPYFSGCVPYYVFVVRPSCPTYYRPWIGNCYSSWDGWGRWNTLWGSHLVRYKSPPPPGYVPPANSKWLPHGRGGPANPPPGFLTADVRGRGAASLPRGRLAGEDIHLRSDWRPGGENRRPDVGRSPAGEAPRGDNPGRGQIVERPRGSVRPEPAGRGDGMNGRGGPGGRDGLEGRDRGNPQTVPGRGNGNNSYAPPRGERPQGRSWWESGRSQRGDAPSPRDGRYAPPERRYAPPEGRYAPPERRYAPPPERRYAPPEGRYAPPERRYAPDRREGPPPERRFAPPSSRGGGGDGPRYAGRGHSAPPATRSAPPPSSRGDRGRGSEREKR